MKAMEEIGELMELNNCVDIGKALSVSAGRESHNICLFIEKAPILMSNGINRQRESGLS